MKPTKLILVALVALILVSFVAEKFIVIRMPEDKMNYHWQNMNGIKQVVSQSDLPHRQVIYILQSIDSFQKDVQVSATLDTSSQTFKK